MSDSKSQPSGLPFSEMFSKFMGGVGGVGGVGYSLKNPATHKAADTHHSIVIDIEELCRFACCFLFSSNLVFHASIFPCILFFFPYI
jgi:hypothetical protein